MIELEDDCPDDAHTGIKMHGSVVVGSKGQIVIPSEVRKSLNINSGDSMCVITKHGKAVALIKMDDLEDFMAFMHDEMNTLKKMAIEQAKNLKV